MIQPPLNDDMLEGIQRDTFAYFQDQTNPANGLVFDRETEDEAEIRTLADALYRRVDWQWVQNGKPAVTHGWKPKSGFLKYRWEGYDEALLLYVLGLGLPTDAPAA